MCFGVAICDDDVKDIFTLHKYLEKFELEYDIDFKIFLFTSGEKLLLQYNSTEDFHIIFLDVEMPGISGIETANTIRSKGDYKTNIIFISNYPEYMQDSFNVQPFYYLQKPLTYSVFCNLMQRIIKLYQNTQTIKYIIQHDQTEEFVNIDDILYIEADKNQKSILHFVLKNREVYTKGILQKLKDELANYGFVITYRGFLVNMKYIHYINKTSVTLTTGAEIPLSRRYDRKIHNLFAKYIITFRNR